MDKVIQNPSHDKILIEVFAITSRNSCVPRSWWLHVI